MRLNNSMRDHIVSDQVAKKFHERLTKAKEEFIKEAKRLASKHLDVEIPSGLEEYVRTTCEVLFSFRDVCYEVPFEVKHGEFYLGCNGWVFNEPKSHRLEVELDDYYPQKKHGNQVVPASKTLKNKVEKFASIKKEMNQFETDLKRFLYNCNTDKQVKTDIPELADYFKDAERARGMVPMPADQIERVRKSVVKGD